MYLVSSLAGSAFLVKLIYWAICFAVPPTVFDSPHIWFALAQTELPLDSCLPRGLLWWEGISLLFNGTAIMLLLCLLSQMVLDRRSCRFSE
jgi:hypothetical protein